MKQSRAFIPTMREIPTDVEIKSHQLLLRAGFLRQHTSGVYSYLPFGLKVLKKIEAIVHEEMEAIDAVEMKVPVLQKEKLVQLETPDEEEFSNLFQVADSKKRQYVLGALHKELVTSLIEEEVQSYKQLPLTLYQIVTRFQDRQRPRYGLIKNRESVIQEAYSFHHSKEDLQETYEQMKEAYRTIFSKLHLEQYPIEMEEKSTKIGHQFIALAAEGDEEIAHSQTGSFVARIDEAAVSHVDEQPTEPLQALEEVDTSEQRTIEDIVTMLNISIEKYLKTFIYEVDGEMIAVISRADYPVNELKLKKAVQATTVKLADPQVVEDLLSCDVHSIGPIQLPIGVKVFADHAVSTVVNGVAGANENGRHWVNVNPERDFAVNEYIDLRHIQEGDLAPDGIGTIQFSKGFEVGRTTSLGADFSKEMQAFYVDEAGEQSPFLMGCYQLDLSRIMAILAEQYHDHTGLTWPKNLAPYDIHLVPIDLNDEKQRELATNLYHLLQTYRFGVLFDDRTERAGVKFQDADLIGLPIRITIGQKAEEGILEIKFRNTGETTEWQVEEVTEKLQAYFAMEE